MARRQAQIMLQNKQINDLEKRRKNLINETSALQNRNNDIGNRSIVFGSHQEVARLVINCASPKKEIHTEILKLLNEASKTADDAGASIGRNGRAVRIEVQIVGDRVHNEQEVIDTITDQIASSSGTVVAIVYSVGNAIEGEQALVDLKLFKNQHAYSPNEEVADTVIDGGASRGQILNSLTAFLQNDVKSAAMHRDRGIIPVYGENGQASVGVPISGDQILDMVDRIRAVGRPVRVRALAAGETRSADKLSLNLLVGGN
jgi:hypothetical protein